LVYIIGATFTEEEAAGIETKIGALLQKYGGTVEQTQRLGKFRLTYPIKDQRHGYYVMVILSAEPAAIAKIEENLRIQTDILRHLLLRAEEAGTGSRFELVQFTEVVVEGSREDRARRARAEKKEKDEADAKTEGEKGEEESSEKTETEEAPKGDA
jgi:small subunit ribosomal protein S6